MKVKASSWGRTMRQTQWWIALLVPIIYVFHLDGCPISSNIHLPSAKGPTCRKGINDASTPNTHERNHGEAGADRAPRISHMRRQWEWRYSLRGRTLLCCAFTRSRLYQFQTETTYLLRLGMENNIYFHFIQRKADIKTWMSLTRTRVSP